LHLLHRFWRSQRETYRKRGIVYEAKGDRVRATADYDQADKLELQAMTKPSQAK
jgi:Flp pilus assembly protein TadD